jgi:hypothetical protein
MRASKAACAPSAKAKAALASPARMVASLRVFATERRLAQVEENGNLVRLGMTVDRAQSTLHEVRRGRDHHVADALIERGLEAMGFLGQAGERATVDPGHDVHAFRHAAIVGGLEAAHLRVQVVELHGSGWSVRAKRAVARSVTHRRQPVADLELHGAQVDAASLVCPEWPPIDRPVAGV